MPVLDYVRCQVCHWVGKRDRREVNFCVVHRRWACAPCFFAGHC